MNYSGGIIVRRSRIGIRKRQQRANIVMALLFLLILPITAVAIGSRITKWFVLPTINTKDILEGPENIYIDDEESEINSTAGEEANNLLDGDKKDQLNKNLINLNPLSIYMIQVASVTDDANIHLLTDELSEHRFPYGIYKEGHMYKIYTYTSTRRENIEDKVDRVREIYSDAYIASMHIPQKQVYYLDDENKGTREIVENINLLLGLFEESLDNIYRLDKGGKELDEYKKILLKQEDILRQINISISDGSLPMEFANKDHIEKMIKSQEEYIRKSLKIIEEKTEPYDLQNYFLGSLFSIIEVLMG